MHEFAGQLYWEELRNIKEAELDYREIYCAVKSRLGVFVQFVLFIFNLLHVVTFDSAELFTIFTDDFHHKHLT